MNHELLLKTEVPVNKALPARSQATPDGARATDTERYQVFSSELGKQIDKQGSIGQTETKINKTADSSAAVNTANTAKAEHLVDKNGNSLPSEQALTLDLTEQILGDFDGEPATKQALTQIIEQFVHKFVNEESPDNDLADSVSGLLNQLLNAGLDEQPELKLQQTQEVTEIVAGGEVAAKPIDPEVTLVTQATAVSTAIANPAQQSLPLEKGTALQQTGTSEQKIENTKTKQEQAGNSTSVIQQLKELVTKTLNANPKGDQNKAQAITAVVKQFLATKSATTSVSDQITSVQTSENTPAIKVGGHLRADILQALTGKSTGLTPASTTLNDEGLKSVTANVIQGDTKSTEGKQAERMTQLLDLLKPAKSDEQFTRTMSLDKVPSIPSFASTLTPVSMTNNLIRADLPTLDIQPSLQSKAWNNVLSSRVVWMASEGIQQAALKLNPANLGPVEVKLTMHNEQTHVTFISHNAATRDALEQAIPRLRESFIENGLELADANVSDHASQQTNDEEMPQDNDARQNGDGTIIMRENIHENAEGVVTHDKQDIELGVSVYA